MNHEELIFIDDFKIIMKTTSPLGKTIKKHIVPLPEIPLEWKRETRLREEKIEKMLL